MDRKFYNDRGVIARWREFLPIITDQTPVISLNEGTTPLIYAPRLSALVGRGCRVFIKHEGLNPTGSFKDRGMTVALSKAVEAGARAVICASRATPRRRRRRTRRGRESAAMCCSRRARSRWAN